MIKKTNQKLTLDRPATYQIKIPGELDDIWSDWRQEMVITIERNTDGLFVTILTGIFDQAALQGLLRHLYSQGIPLISVICLDFN